MHGQKWETIFLVFFCLIQLPLRPADLEIRTVGIKLVFDDVPQNVGPSKPEVISHVYECCGIFRRQFGIKLDVRQQGRWHPGSKPALLNDALSELRNQVPPGDCEIVLGIISPEHVAKSSLGISSYVQGYVLLQNSMDLSLLRYALLHELCHIFGALDLREKSSIMSIQDPSFRIDDFTRQAVFVNKNRVFDRASFPIPEENLDQAMALYKERADLHLDEPEASLYEALICFERKDFDRALEICAVLGRNNPDLLGIHNILGNIHFAAGHIHQAIEEYQIAAELQPDEVGIHFNLGQAYLKEGNIESAWAEYGRALKLNPDFAPAHSSLGYLYILTKRPDAAMTECTAALKSNPVDPEALCILGCALLLKSEPGLAGVAAGMPDEEDHNSASEDVASQFNQAVQEATAFCRRAISIKPDIPEAHNALGAALAYQKRLVEAEAEFSKAIEFRADYEEAHYNLALIYYKTGRADKAIHQLEKILEIDPATALGAQILGRIFQAQNKYAVIAESVIR